MLTAELPDFHDAPTIPRKPCRYYAMCKYYGTKVECKSDAMRFNCEWVQEVEQS